MDFFSGANNIIGIATILGTIAAWIALYPIVQPYLLKLTGKTIPVDEFETSYLISLEKDLETKNQNNRWSNKFYVNVDVELQERKKLYEIPPSFYVVKAINRHLKDQDFNNLSNVEKIDSSRGQTFTSLQSAIDESQDNAVVVISPPGNGKTVSLRNLTVKKIKQRLAGQSNVIPIFINLGYYTGFNSDGTIQEFASFLENFFGSTGYYRYLSNGYWETLLRQSRCIFLLDGIDELPRRPEEYDARSKKITEFVRAWPNAQFILSCRELDYNRELAFQQILIKPFDQHHIRSYLRKYITHDEYKTISQQIEESSGIYELCTNPFYLDLVSYFSKFNKKVPENKAQLFDFIIDKFIERENAKSDTLIARQDFIHAMSNLAYYLAVKKMITTININEYSRTIKNHPDQQMYLKIINLAIQGGLLEFNEQSQEIRFIHNRFQEFFSSHHIVRNYRKDNKSFPDNFFTNIWWKETVLFVAGLDDSVDEFIAKILSYRDKQLLGQSLLGRLLRLEVTSLAFECIFANISFHNEQLYTEIRDELIQEYHTGDTLIKAKVLNAFRHDKSEKVLSFLETAIDDESLWVSERAFFMLTDEQVRFQLTPKGILREFFKFFIEGRLINIFIPLWKSAAKSRLIKAFLPVYLLLVIASILSIPLVGYVFYSFIEFIVFKLDLAFTAECIRCLLTISMGIFVIIYALTKNNYPILKRFISVLPLAFLIRYLVFNIPDNFIYKLIMGAVGILFFSLYGSYLKKPNESDYSPGSITAFILGFSIPIPVLNFKAFAALFNVEFFNSTDWTQFNSIKTTIDIFQPYLMAIFLVVSVAGLSIYIYREAQVIKKLNEYSEYVETKLSIESFNDSKNLAKSLIQMFESLSIIWAQEILLKKVIDRMTGYLNFSREQKITFLNLLAHNTSNIYISDKVYQYIEDEQNNLRRTINSQTVQAVSASEQEILTGNLMDNNTPYTQALDFQSSEDTNTRRVKSQLPTDDKKELQKSSKKNDLTIYYVISSFITGLLIYSAIFPFVRPIFVWLVAIEIISITSSVFFYRLMKRKNSILITLIVLISFIGVGLPLIPFLVLIPVFSIINQAIFYEIGIIHSAKLKIFVLFRIWRQESLTLEKIVSNLLGSNSGIKNNEAIIKGVDRLIYIYAKEKQIAKAEALLLKCIKSKVEPASSLNFKLGQIYHSQKNYKEAIISFSEALKLDNGDMLALNMRGICLMRLGQYQEAIESFLEIIRLKPEMTQAYYNIACVYALQNKADNACQWIRKSVEIDRKILQSIKSDKDLDTIRDSKDFKELQIELKKD